MNEANNLQIPTQPPLVIPDVSNCPFSIVFNVDCVQGLKRFADNYFDLAIVDPPYGIGMDGGNVGYKGFNNFEKRIGIRKFQMLNILQNCLEYLKIR